MKRIMLLLFVLSLLVSMPVLAQAKGGPGAVYAMTNADEDHGGNQIVVYHRAADGMLTLVDTFDTNGKGKTTEAGDALGASNPLILSPDHRWLFAVNAGSNSISVFETAKDGLRILEVVPSGGDFPASLTMHHNLLYVLNAGGDGNITGFTQDTDGHLTPLADSTRSLNAGGTNPPFFLDSPAQVGFNPLGEKLVVTVKNAIKNAMSGIPPKIHVFAVDGDGLPSAQPVTNKTNVSFGFVFDDLENLLVAEPFGSNPPGMLFGAAASYRVAADGGLVSISDSMENRQTATCWIAITTNTRFAYTTNNGGDGSEDGGTISSYKVGPDGSLRLISEIAARTGHAPVDLAITPTNQYLYNVNAGDGTVSMFKIDQKNGKLIFLGEIEGLPDDGSAVGIAAR